MKSKRATWLRLTWKILRLYGIEIWFILVFANLVAFVSIRLLAVGGECMSSSAIASDSRCLYVYQGDIYSQGTRSRPHKGHACGMDVSSIIPSNHIGNTAKYLLPNYVAKLCTATPPSPTPPPSSATPTKPPVSNPTATTAPQVPTTTRMPTITQSQVNPTGTPRPTISAPIGGGISTPVPTAFATATGLPPVTPPTSAPRTPTPAASPASGLHNPTPTPTPGANPGGGGFGEILDELALNPGGVTPSGDSGFTDSPPIEPTGIPFPSQGAAERYNFVFWSTWIVYIAFWSLVGVAVLWIMQKIKARRR